MIQVLVTERIPKVENITRSIHPEVVLRPPRKEATSGLPYIVVVVTSWNSPLRKLWEAWELILLLRASGSVWVDTEKLQMAAVYTALR